MYDFFPVISSFESNLRRVKTKIIVCLEKFLMSNSIMDKLLGKFS